MYSGLFHEVDYDRGGIRGIVELEILKAIETELPVNIPVSSFFDLVVGTRFVHRISLLRPITCCKRAFTHLWMRSNFLQFTQLYDF